MSNEVWYIALETFKGSKDMFWKSELYDIEEIEWNGFTVDELLSKGKISFWSGEKKSIDVFAEQIYDEYAEAKLRAKEEGRTWVKLDTLKNIVAKDIKKREGWDDEFVMNFLDVDENEYRELHKMLDVLLSNPLILERFEQHNEIPSINIAVSPPRPYPNITFKQKNYTEHLIEELSVAVAKSDAPLELQERLIKEFKEIIEEYYSTENHGN